ncbi:MAG: tetratricopeptide repeat protein, partial [Candidatus Brocadiae bacterium]|nr:tetratricopeptide repeat protein [Candidatus Brocadiia bacterium]
MGAAAAAEVPPLSQALSELADELAALAPPGSRCALNASPQAPLLDGYAAHLLATHLTYRGLAARRESEAARGLDASGAEQLPACLMQKLRSEGTDLFVHCATGVEEGERYLTATAYAATGGRQQACIRKPFHLAGHLEPLVSAQRSPMDLHDANWLELFEELFPPSAADESGLPALLDVAAGGYFMEVGLWHEAAGKFLGATQPLPNRHFMRGIFALQLAGKDEEAAEVVRSALNEYSDSGPLYALQSLVSLRQGDLEKAILWLDQARYGDMAREGLYRYARALIALEQGDHETAERELVRGAQMLPDKLFAQARLASFYRDRGELEKAITYYRQATATERCTCETWKELAIVLDVTGQTDAAIEALRQAFRLRSDSASVSRHLASLLKRKGQYEGALDVLRQAAEANPCKPELLAAYGDWAAEMWRTREAHNAYARCLGVDSEFAYGEVRLAAMLARQRRYREAKQRLMDLLAVRLDYHPARIELGRILGELGHVEEALSELAEASKSPEHEASARLAMAAVNLNAARPEEAVRNAQIAAGFSRQDAATYATLCRAFLASGDVDKAQSAAQKALEEDQLSAEAHLAIARVRDA